MWKYYWGVTRDTAKEFKDGSELWLFVGGVAVFAFGKTLANRMLREIAGRMTPQVISWVSNGVGIFVGLLVLWVILRTNYARFLSSDGQTRVADAKLKAFLEKGSRIDSVSISRAEPGEGHFDILADIAMPDATALSQWDIALRYRGNSTVRAGLSCHIGWTVPASGRRASRSLTTKPSWIVPVYSMRDLSHCGART